MPTAAVMPSSRYLNVNELAKELRLHPQTIRRMVQDGEIPALRAGLQFRFDLAAVLAALAVRPMPDIDTLEPRTPP